MSQVSLVLFVLYIFGAALVMADDPQTVSVGGISVPSFAGAEQIGKIPGVSDVVSGMGNIPGEKQFTGALNGGAEQFYKGMNSVPGVSRATEAMNGGATQITNNFNKVPGTTQLTDAVNGGFKGCPVVSQLGDGASGIPGLQQVQAGVNSFPDLTQINTLTNVVNNDEPEATQL